MPQRLKGKIQAYSNAVNAGTITCEDQKIYLFSRKDWNSAEDPEVDLKVSFFIEGNKAKSIVVETSD